MAGLCATLRDPPFQRSDVLTTDDFRHPRQFLCLFAQPLQLVSTNFVRSEEHTSELQSLMRISYAVFCLKKKKHKIVTKKATIKNEGVKKSNRAQQNNRNKTK